MSQIDDEIQRLLERLKLRIKRDQIPDGDRKTIVNFLQKEISAQEQHRIARILATCGLKPKQMRTFDQLNWDFNPKIPKQEILAFRNSSWIEEARNLVLIGDVGIAKSHIVKSLLYDAALGGHSALFISVFDLLSKIKGSPTPYKRIDYYGKNIRVLCLDELGYTFHSKEDTDLLFQIISKRSEALPTLVTTNLSPKKWGTIFSGMAASAILDRLSYKGKFLAWEGPSGRTPKDLSN